MKKVVVLMSTYNGEKYISQQIESILNQDGVEIRLLIRDDGSTDATIDIINRYISESDVVSIYTGPNLKPARSFLDLVKEAPLGDYYAFADQDDIWDSDKLKTAVEFLEKEDDEQPLLYYSNLRVVDGDLRFYRNAHNKPHVLKNRWDALIESMPSGCTMVFNNHLRSLINHKEPEFCSMHDVWIYMIAMFFGKAIYDFTPHINYRVHGNNVCGAYKKKTIKIYLNRFKRIFNRKEQPRVRNANSFLNSFGDMLDQDDLSIVKEVAFYKASFKARMKLLFEKRIHSSTFEKAIRFRLLTIFGLL